VSDVLDRHEVALVVWPSRFAGELFGRLLAQLAHRELAARYTTTTTPPCSPTSNVAGLDRRLPAFRLAYRTTQRRAALPRQHYLDANEFERSPVQMREVLRSFPGAAASHRRTAGATARGAGPSGSPDACSGAAYQVRGDGARAVEQPHRGPPERGLSGPATTTRATRSPGWNPPPAGEPLLGPVLARVRESEMISAMPPPHQRPEAVFVGRHDELEECARVWKTPSRAAEILPRRREAGIGKTRTGGGAGS